MVEQAGCRNRFTGRLSWKYPGSKLVAMLEREHKGFLNTWTHADRVKMMSSKGRIPLISFSKKHLNKSRKSK